MCTFNIKLIISILKIQQWLVISVFQNILLKKITQSWFQLLSLDKILS